MYINNQVDYYMLLILKITDDDIEDYSCVYEYVQCCHSCEKHELLCTWELHRLNKQ